MKQTNINNQIYVQINNQAFTRQPQIKPCESACSVPIATHDHVVNFRNKMYIKRYYLFLGLCLGTYLTHESFLSFKDPFQPFPNFYKLSNNENHLQRHLCCIVYKCTLQLLHKVSCDYLILYGDMRTQSISGYTTKEILRQVVI